MNKTTEALKQPLGDKEYSELAKRLEGETYFATPHSPTNCKHCGCDLPNHYAGCSAIAYPFGGEA